jgi:hypothetical protein
MDEKGWFMEYVVQVSAAQASGPDRKLVRRAPQAGVQEFFDLLAASIDLPAPLGNR